MAMFHARRRCAPAFQQALRVTPRGAPRFGASRFNYALRALIHTAPRAQASHEGKFRFSVDRGGTFTDLYAEIPMPDGTHMSKVVKLLSEDPSNYSDAPTEGIRRVLEDATGVPHPRGHPIDTSRIESIRMGTTVATNALLERKGEPMALVITAGFKDLLKIGNQARPAIFDLEVKTPEVLYQRVVEVPERVVLEREGWSSPARVQTRVEGSTGETVLVEQSLDVDATRAELQRVYDAGIRSVAVVCLHSYTFPDHELLVGQLARDIGFSQVSLSHQVMPMVKAVARGYTAMADAYLTPAIMKYLDGFRAGFDEHMEANGTQVLFMQSDGGLTPASAFSGHKAILSGPAGGVVGYAKTAYDTSSEQPVIGFDMGGTSTDVSRYAGDLELVYETSTAGITIQAPQLDVNTVAAGGGSRLFLRSGMFAVGPESAGAHPGPVCYRKRGHLAVTDANVALGRVQPDFFPRIFGEGENEALDVEGSLAAFEEMAASVNRQAKQEADRRGEGSDFVPKTVDEVAHGFLEVANEAMCRPIRELTQMRGYDSSTHALACFGGAGGQHACAIARKLGIRRIHVHKMSGILSAYGIALSDIAEEVQAPCAVDLESANYDDIAARITSLEDTATERLSDQGFDKEHRHLTRFVNLRYHGTDTASMMPLRPGLSTKDALGYALEDFEAQTLREFGFKLSGRPVAIDDVRVRGVGLSSTSVSSPSIPEESPHLPAPVATRQVYFRGGRVATALYSMEHLSAGMRVPSPAILIDATSTVLVSPGFEAVITEDDNVVIEWVGGDAERTDVATTSTGPLLKPDAAQLGIFGHRFMGIAEQMGRVLQRTSISVNMKERLDFSCAIFDADGGLVANAPHIPVHLGAMQDAVRLQMKWWKGDLKEGDVLVSNHPQLAGGSHLPDITVMTPVFHDGHIVFFVASRGHHGDIGGIAPGSMPPNSKLLQEEGAAIVKFKLVTGGHFQEEGITELLMAPGTWGIPHCSGARNVSEVISDLKAQVAANQQGIRLVQGLIQEYDLETVQAYMGFIQHNAEHAVRRMLREFAAKHNMEGEGSVYAEDHMDDGSRISLRITIDASSGDAVFDFSGTDPEVFGNHNAPPAVTYSAVIYSLRCLVGTDIPLNQGCLAPVDIRIPEGCLLNPSPTAGVVGGNVLTSQRVVDVVLKAFGACAASYGCMNNFTFGDDTMGYYETIAGGSGAGPTWHGSSGVQAHMTNTRITDPEIFERRYPVVLRQFSLREASGGRGAFRGGDGIVRKVEFRKDVTASLLSDRRAFQPYGLAGGEPGARGKALVTYSENGRVVSLGGKNTVKLVAGDDITVLTQGGGGYGTPKDED